MVSRRAVAENTPTEACQDGARYRGKRFRIHSIMETEKRFVHVGRHVDDPGTVELCETVRIART